MKRIGIGLLAILALTVLALDGATTTRVEDTNSAVAYQGAWQSGNTDRSWSGGTAAVTTEALARATFTFMGTSVSWIGFRGPQAGRARVYLDGTPVASVDAYSAGEQLQAVLFSASGLTSGTHTIVVEVTGRKHNLATNNFIVVDAFDVTAGSSGDGGNGAFAPGDVFVSLEPGPVQWRRPNGMLVRTLVGAIPGLGEGMGFDAAGNLYVTRWRLDSNPDATGNTTEVFNVSGQPSGAYGSAYDCDPHAIVFDPAGTGYVGQAGCTGSILKFVPGQPPVQLDVAPDNAGAFWIDLAADNCTIFYTSWGPNVKRYDGCARVQRSNFNKAPLPGGETHDLRVLPDGGVLVSSGAVIARLDAAGVLVQTYTVSGEYRPWTGLDLVGDGTFWAGNYESSNVYRFNLMSGAIVSVFNTGTPPHTVVDVAVRK
jgi:hypothetical protein